MSTETTHATGLSNEQLIEYLKFTPCTYKINLWGYGGEYVMGTVDRRIYDYFRSRRLSVTDFAWDNDYANEQNIPEEMCPFTPGSWYECEDIGHVYGVDKSSGTLQIIDDKNEVIYERELDGLDGCDVMLSTTEEIWVDSQDPGTVVFVGHSSDKGHFFEANIELTSPFDPEKLCLNLTEFDGNDIVTGVTYDDVELENFGGDTSGKGSDHAFYIAGSSKQNGNGFERYRDMEDIKYTLTDWYPARIKPVRVGNYNVNTKERYEYRAHWNGTNWHNEWTPDKKLTITKWQGIAYNPDEQDLRNELDQIILDNCGQP